LGGVPPVSQSAEAAVRTGEICLRVGSIVTNLAEAAKNVVAFRKRSARERWIEERKEAIN
jgi:hypothetical protein